MDCTSCTAVVIWSDIIPLFSLLVNALTTCFSLYIHQSRIYSTSNRFCTKGRKHREIFYSFLKTSSSSDWFCSFMQIFCHLLRLMLIPSLSVLLCLTSKVLNFKRGYEQFQKEPTQVNHTNYNSSY